MGLRINTNTASLRAQTALKDVGEEKQESLAKLSSGHRITKAADDAAGLAISEKINAEVRSTRQANRNANDGMALVQTAEGALSEASSLLTRMRELSMQAASDTYSDVDRSMSNQEYQQLKNELERISQSTEFNGRKLLDGSGKKLDFQVGTGNHSTDDQVSYDTGVLNSNLSSLGVSSLTIQDKVAARSGLNQLDAAITKVSGQRAMIGSLQNRLLSSSNNLSVYTENMSGAYSRIRDVDFAEETSKLAKHGILEQAGTMVLSQANTDPKTALKLMA
jgi:flagellin